jgi:glycosyltransferase involved in cell wall biosynthesis
VNSNNEKPAQKKLLVISPWESLWSLGEGAGVSDDYEFIKKFCRSGIELHFLVPGGGTGFEVPFENFFVHTYPNFFKITRKLPKSLRRILWPILFNIIVAARALHVARVIRPDFVLGHSYYGSFPGYLVREFFGIPSGVKLFGVMDLVHSEWPRLKYIYKNLEQIIALKIPQHVWIILDDGTRGRDAALRHGIPDDRIRFLPNGVNLEWAEGTYDRKPLRRELDIPPDAVVVLFLARLVDSKRPEAAIHAAARVKPPAARRMLLLVVGDGEERRECECLVDMLGIRESVRFIGAVPHSEVPKIMHASDIFLSTSRLTNMAIPSCEAFVCGLPLVAFDVGDTGTAVGEGERGLAVQDANIDALASAIASLIEDDTRRARMGQQARKYAMSNFVDWDTRTEMELGIIQDLIHAEERD